MNGAGGLAIQATGMGGLQLLWELWLKGGTREKVGGRDWAEKGPLFKTLAQGQAGSCQGRVEDSGLRGNPQRQPTARYPCRNPGPRTSTAEALSSETPLPLEG